MGNTIMLARNEKFVKEYACGETVLTITTKRVIKSEVDEKNNGKHKEFAIDNIVGFKYGQTKKRKTILLIIGIFLLPIGDIMWIANAISPLILFSPELANTWLILGAVSGGILIALGLHVKGDYFMDIYFKYTNTKKTLFNISKTARNSSIETLLEEFTALLLELKELDKQFDFNTYDERRESFTESAKTTEEKQNNK